MSARPDGRAMRLQFGALPYRISEQGEVQVLLITSRTTRRWIIPKGWPMKGLKPAKAAAREAFEEAGIRGKTGTKTIGRFTYDKVMEDEGIAVPCEVTVFPLHVKRQLEDWPERDQRETRWVTSGEVHGLIGEQGLVDLIQRFAVKQRAGR